MDMNQTPSANRTHISFFGKTNAGKSSLINAITSQEVSLVSEIKGTTTDPVSKSMEILPLGPVVLTDTPGIDDNSILGSKRISRTKQVLDKTDIAVLVVDITKELDESELEIINLFKEKSIPYILVFNKMDILKSGKIKLVETESAEAGSAENLNKIIENRLNQNSTDFYQTSNKVAVSSITGENINTLKEILGNINSDNSINMENDCIISDKLCKNDTVILVVPIDSAAPKGRLILPQQQTIRDILDAGARAIVVQETELTDTIAMLKVKPKIVITDSQVFNRVKKEVPEDIFLTSFSILFARKKGDISYATESAKVINELKTGSKILISEGCTHHRQCDDIGTVKLPRWIKEYTKKEFEFDFTSGGTFPDDISCYDLIIHCGGCMLNRKEMQHRISRAIGSGIPMTNYGIIIAHMQGILERSLEIFRED